MKRLPPPIGHHGIVYVTSNVRGNFCITMMAVKLTAEQLREAAHTLNQLAEYLEDD